ncbi:DUF3883 domain-containing protein [Oscillatoria sp. FACHB-1407]|uniref:sacsin N-terminal ATP-binding-like domain-containing protein n=1 Tax=Oscillatoria sp. FACHB-1407 TaxID=2692847 RepID=UPI001687DF4C|nr:DUF3883 domain-containing protein [Oscillatoria sp. FACHB-1407]MBD2463940.1 DUF3883 domain-containing protein [Oscillatoria sp. FACHB-1407]
MGGIGLGKGEAWYQSEPLTTRLKNLIRDYPEGVGIIKELIQNADDAGATCVEIVFDWRTHNFKQLPDPRMEALMGAAMLVYNDSSFTDQDFQNIQSLGDSGKRETLWKTGRFGVGFNSVYHVTDYPSFISRDRLVFLDPHATAIPDATPGQPGRSWRFAEEGWWDYPDFMQVYEPGGLQPGTSEFQGTLFRLPLRTPIQAKKSKIRNEPFTQENVRQLLTEFVKVGEEMLLFLKSVLTIRVSEIGSNGNKNDLLSITTQNAQIVKAERSKLLAPLQKGAEALLNLCQSNPNALPAVSYQHKIKVDTAQNQTTSTWRVTSLMRAEGELLRLMRELATQGEKAVPWAGTAALISRTSNSQPKDFVGRAYCFLPLPQETGLPVHINGFFDLDSSRRELTSDTLTGRDTKRVLWNQLLVRHVLSHAYANLILSLVEDIGETDPARFYKFFPTQSPTKALAELPILVIKLLQSKRVIRSAIEHIIQQNGQQQVGKTHWVTPQTINILPKGWDHLLEPLRLDNIDLPDPTLPFELETAFARAQTPFTVFKPADLRSRLLTNKPLGMPVENAPKECLRQREWVVNLLRYCLSDGCRDVRGLPLAILADGTLQTFGYNPPGFIYTVSLGVRQILMDYIFASCPNWFLNTNLSDQVREISECSGVSILTPVEVAKRLKDFVDPEDYIAIEWQPDGTEIPNASWLTQVYAYLADVKTLPIDELREVALVPCNDGLLYVGGSAETPLWHGSSTSREILDTLQYFEIPLIKTQESLQRAIATFRSRHPDTLIFRLTVPGLIDTLEAQENLPTYNSELYKGLISFLADRDWMRGEGKNDADRKRKLRQLQIYPTVEDQPTDLKKDVYIPGGYIPPKVAGSLNLLCLGPSESSQEWKAFYDFLGVSVLDHVTMIQNLLKDYASLQSNQQLEALEWIRDHLSIAQTELEKRSQSLNLEKQVQGAPLIRCTDGHLRPASAIYNPKTYNQVRQVLGDRAHTPDMTIYKNVEHWLGFFQKLGMLVTPSASDLLAYVDGQIQQAQNGVTSEIAKHLVAIFTYIEKHWDRLENKKISSEKSLAEALKIRAWLPVERDPEKLNRFPAFTVPQNKLYRSSEVCFSPYGSLVASQKPLLPIGKLPSKEFQTALGFSTYPDQQSVVNHFKTLIDLWSETRGNGIDNEAFHKSVQNIYGYFHNIFCSTGSSEKGQQWLRDQLDGYECLWDYGQFWLPEHTFQKKVPFFGKRRQKILIDKPQIRQVYELLGQKKSPDISDYVAFLEEVAADCKGNSLSEDDGKCVCEVLKLLTQDLETEQCSAADYDLLLLTDDNLLLPPDQILIPDAPWRLDAIVGRDQVKILHPEVPHSLAIDAGSRSLLSDVVEKPTKIELLNHQNANKFCQKWQNLLRSSEFINGLERLIIDQYGLDIEAELSWLARVEVKAAATITTNLLLHDRCIASGLQGNYFFEPNKCVFYLSYKSEKLMRNYLTDSLNQRLDNLKLKLADTARLQTIIESHPSEIEQLLDELRVKHLKRSPLVTVSFEETDEDEVDEIFDGNFLDEFAIDDGDDGTTSSNNGREPASSAATSASNGSSTGQAIAKPFNGNAPQPPIPKPAPAPSTSNSSPAVSSPVSSTPTQPTANPIIKPAKPTPAAPQRRGILDVKPAAQSTGQDDSEGIGQSDFEERDRRPPLTPSVSRRNNVIRLRQSSGSGRSKSASRRRSQPRTTYSSQQYRNGVRVRSGLEVDPNKNAETELTESEARKIDQAGMARVMEYERQHGRAPQDMNEIDPNHAGYDIKSTDQRSGEERYIEVKSLRGVWDRRGVCMTLKQFETGNVEQDKFWLYVVEQAESDEAKVTPIQNPVGLVGEFYYDDSWRQLADDEANKEG